MARRGETDQRGPRQDLPSLCGPPCLAGPAGTLVLVEPAAKRSAVAEEPGTTILAVGGKPGRASQPSGWELWAPARSAYENGDYERAIGLIAPIVADHPEYATLAYNLACCESLAGRADDAIAHLAAALETSEDLRRLARSDSDLDPLRGDPRFAALVASE